VTDLSLQRHFAQPAPIPLGIDTKSPAISTAAPAIPDAGGSKRRAERYQLQRVAQRCLPETRVSKCSRWPSHYRDDGIPSVDVLLNRTTGKASFGNLSVCGSVWHCPVCAAYITERRREELQQAITAWSKRGGRIALMTLTFPHGIDERAQSLIDKLADARSKFFGARAFKETMRAVQAPGRVFALEITTGANGWHPHLHILIFYKGDEAASLDSMEQLREFWAGSVRRAGLGTVNEHGFDVRGGDYAAEYVAKFGKEPSSYLFWSAAHELTKSHIKRGKESSLSPFDLLRLVQAGKTITIGDRTIAPDQAAALFLEYADAFHGRRQLTWSRGLREALDLDHEQSDEALAESEARSEQIELVARLDRDDWRTVVTHNARGYVIYLTEQHRSELVVREFIRMLRAKPPNDDDAFGVMNWHNWGP
jgi:hypothetical protein